MWSRGVCNVSIDEKDGFGLNKKQLVLLIILSAIPFVFYLFHHGFGDYDSYYFLAFVCEKNFHTFDASSIYYPIPPLAKEVFSLLPCNFFVLKIVLFLLFASSVIIIAKTGELLYDNGWITGLFTFFTPILWRNSLKLENDAFGLVFCYLSTYFFVKYLKKKNNLDFVLSCASFLIGAGFWPGTLYLSFGYALLAIPFIGASIFIAYFFGQQLTNSIFGNPLVLENQSAGSLVNLLGYFPALIKIETFSLMSVTIFFAGFGLLNPKFLVLGVPFFCLALTHFVQKYTTWENFLIYLAIILAIGFGATMLFYDYNPKKGEFEATQIAIDLAKEKNLELSNDWPLGYIVNWLGGTPSAWAGPGQLQQDIGIVLTSRELDCLKHFETDYDFNTGKLYVYEC